MFGVICLYQKMKTIVIGLALGKDNIILSYCLCFRISFGHYFVSLNSNNFDEIEENICIVCLSFFLFFFSSLSFADIMCLWLMRSETTVVIRFSLNSVISTITNNICWKKKEEICCRFVESNNSLWCLVWCVRAWFMLIRESLKNNDDLTRCL